MSDLAIRLENIGKLYRLGQTVGYGTLRDSIAHMAAAPFHRLSKAHSNGTRTVKDGTSYSHYHGPEYIWALKDISFKVKQGEAVAVIGSNGAGKSTLLKILSRITSPTTGYAEVHGRIGSLLEIGTGFHPELTGRENIYFNGSILGMKRDEIKRVFDQIVDFAGLEKFLDTPVKRYSSGMYVRLGFAVAAHLEPEIMVVDEVLAVGDAAFQKKCLGKMSDVIGGGRTVIFVSHNMSAARTLCPRAILLNHGEIEMEGDSAKVIQHYLGTDRKMPSRVVWVGAQRPGNHSFKINSIALKSLDGSPSALLEISRGGYFEIDFEVIEERAQANFSLILQDADGEDLFSSVNNLEPNFFGKPLPSGRYITSCLLPGNLLGPGDFSITIIGSGAHWSDYFKLNTVLSFSTVDDGVLGKNYYGSYIGALRPKLEWNTQSYEENAKE
jgi:lipopolysaccharide transport system ATP-binding protein